MSVFCLAVLWNCNGLSAYICILRMFLRVHRRIMLDTLCLSMFLINLAFLFETKIIRKLYNSPTLFGEIKNNQFFLILCEIKKYYVICQVVTIETFGLTNVQVFIPTQQNMNYHHIMYFNHQGEKIKLKKFTTLLSFILDHPTFFFRMGVYLLQIFIIILLKCISH